MLKDVKGGGHGESGDRLVDTSQSHILSHTSNFELLDSLLVKFAFDLVLLGLYE